MIHVALISFILTFVIEYVIIAAFVKKGPARTAVYTFLINALTWPIANVLFTFVPMSVPFILVGILIEFGVFLVEAPLISSLFEIGREKSLITSGVANFLSAFIGFLIMLFGLIF